MKYPDVQIRQPLLCGGGWRGHLHALLLATSLYGAARPSSESPRSLAALAGSRSTYVDCFAFAVQIAAVSLPIWHFSLNLRPDIELKGNPFVYDPGWIGIGTGFFANYRCKFIAKRRLKAADYLRLGSLFRLKVTAVGSRLIENKTVCRHCGFRELTYDFQTMHIEVEPSGPCLGLSLAYDLLNAILIPRELAVSLRSASVAGCTLSPVGGSEPADWYALHSDHILPQAIFSPRSRKQMPYMTRSVMRITEWSSIRTAGMWTSATVDLPFTHRMLAHHTNFSAAK